MGQLLKLVNTLKMKSRQQNLYLQIFKNISPKLDNIKNSKRANSVDLDEVPRLEQPYKGLCCLEIQLFPFLMLKVLEDFALLGKMSLVSITFGFFHQKLKSLC